jgi:hypothetical protein
MTKSISDLGSQFSAWQQIRIDKTCSGFSPRLCVSVVNSFFTEN